jgi:hypothetical protein
LEVLVKETKTREEKLLLAIGAFIYEFSSLEFNIRWALASALKLGGNRFDAVISPYDFAMLCKVTSVVLALAEDQETKKEQIERTFDACFNVNDVRNKIVHGTWLVGSGARLVSRETLKPSIYFEQVDEIVEKTNEIKKLQKDIAALGPRIPISDEAEHTPKAPDVSEELSD